VRIVRPRRGVETFACCLLALGLAAPAFAAESEPPQRFSVLQLNIWNEGRTVDGGFEKIVEVILAVEADIVAFSEVRNRWWIDWHEKVVARLAARGATYYGMYAGGDVGLISRFPIRSTSFVFDRTGDDQGSVMAYHLELPGGQPLIVCSAHLDYRHYGLNLVRGYSGGNPNFKLLDEDDDGSPDRSSNVEAVLAYNRRSQKDEAIEAFLAFAAREGRNGTPIVLAGDFNDASHLDWVEETRGAFGHNDVVIAWPNTQRLEAQGFVDAYRALYPDPLANPGTTWPAPAFGKGSTSWVPLSDERDRIDYVLFKAETLRPTAGFIVGPRGTFAYDEPTANVGSDRFVAETLPWPSDHKGVLIEFEYTPPAKSANDPPSP
jgi:endonuclease/exonuclease/phosphatase family metal-dependent hydrolase